MRTPPPIAYVSLFLLGVLTAAAAKTTRDFLIESNHRELLRVTSPDAQVDAVFVRPVVGYFDYSSELHLVPKGETAPGWGAVVRISEVTQTPKLTWRNPQLVELNFSRGCVNAFTNYWHSSDIKKGTYYVEIRIAGDAEYSCLKPAPAAQTTLPRRGPPLKP